MALRQVSSKEVKTPQWSWVQLLAMVASWLAVVVCILIWAMLDFATDRHWIGTLIAFGPRWTLLVPVAMLTFFAALWRPRSLLPLGMAALIIAGPVMGLCVPVQVWLHEKAIGPTF